MFSGIITSSKMFNSGYGGAVFAGFLMLIIGLMFGALAAVDFFMLLRVSAQEKNDHSCSRTVGFELNILIHHVMVATEGNRNK